MAGGRRAWRKMAAALLTACEIADPSDDILPPDQAGPELAPCTPAEAVFLRATLEPRPTGERVELTCELMGRAGQAGFFALELRCGEEAVSLLVEAEPAPASDGFAPGQTLRLLAIRAPGEAGEDDTWLRVETAKGALLLAIAAGTRVDPPDGSAWATPFGWREASGTCMVEETGCGASQRGALDVQLSGGPPVRLYDGTAKAVGDKGSHLAYVEAARAVPPGSGCPRELAFGLLATR